MVQLKERLSSLDRLSGRTIILQIHLLVFHRAPETLPKDIVERSSTAIHADVHPCRL